MPGLITARIRGDTFSLHKHIEHPTEFNRDIVGPSVIIFSRRRVCAGIVVHALTLVNFVYIFNGLLLSRESIRSGT